MVRKEKNEDIFKGGGFETKEVEKEEELTRRDLLKKVGRDLDLRNTKISSLPKGLKVGGKLED